MNHTEEILRLQAEIKKLQRNRFKSFVFKALLVTVLPVAIYALSKPHTFSDGEIISASKINENFDTIFKRGFGEWQATISEGVNYQAATDGFVVGTIIGTANDQGVQRISGFSDGNAAPSTIRSYASISGHMASNYTNSQADTLIFPVRKGDYFRVQETHNVGSINSTRTYYWLPFEK